MGIGCACGKDSVLESFDVPKIMRDYSQNDLKIRLKATDSGIFGKRHPKYIFQITFNSERLGITISSGTYCHSAYVTKVDGSRNKAVQEMPLNSKLLKCNGVDVESDNIDDIEKAIMAGKKNLPLTLTFCHPDGLFENEYPDPNLME